MGSGCVHASCYVCCEKARVRHMLPTGSCWVHRKKPKGKQRVQGSCNSVAWCESSADRQCSRKCCSARCCEESSGVKCRHHELNELEVQTQPTSDSNSTKTSIRIPKVPNATTQPRPVKDTIYDIVQELIKQDGEEGMYGRVCAWKSKKQTAWLHEYHTAISNGLGVKDAIDNAYNTCKNLKNK